MKFRLYLGYKNGKPIDPKKIARSQPIIGEFVIEDWRESKDTIRASRVARIKEITLGSIQRGLHRPLFDPVLIKVTDRYMLLEGREIDVVDGEAVYYVQSWILRPIEEGDI